MYVDVDIMCNDIGNRRLFLVAKKANRISFSEEFFLVVVVVFCFTNLSYWFESVCFLFLFLYGCWFLLYFGLISIPGSGKSFSPHKLKSGSEREPNTHRSTNKALNFPKWLWKQSAFFNLSRFLFCASWPKCFSVCLFPSPYSLRKIENVVFDVYLLPAFFFLSMLVVTAATF